MTVTINGTTGIAGVDGSAATPAAQGADTNTGIFYGTDIVGISTGGTERMRVGATGTVSIATTSTPLNIFGVNGSGSFSSGGNVADAGGGIYFAANGVNYTPMSGVKGILYNAASTEDQGGLAFLTRPVGASGQVLTERMRIDASGNLLVGATTVGGVGHTIAGGSNPYHIINNNAAPSGQVFISFRRSGTEVGYIAQNGTTATSYSTTSDYRLKENIQPMQNALDVVSQLNPVTYTWKADGSDGQGFIAHELQAVVPDCVTGEKDAVDEEGNPVYQGIDTSFLVATLTKAIQELSAKNDALEARLAALEAK